jgi:ABC-type branched-subunit amino acid transport system ATPase component
MATGIKQMLEMMPVDLPDAHHRLPTMSPAAAILRIDDIRLAFGGLRALDGASLEVQQGRLTALIGPNGAGKTTLFNVISGLLRADAGAIMLQGADGASHALIGCTPDRINRLGLMRTFQIARGLPKMSVFEHLMLYGPAQPGERLWQVVTQPRAVRAHEAALAEKALAVARRVKLERLIDNPVTALSGGQKKLLEIGRALMAEPRIILFDEPAAGVNPTLAEEIGDQLRAIVVEGRTVLLIEHDMALVGRVADHVIVLAQGRKLAEGSFDEVRDNADVQRAYLGVRAEIAA